jgi:hypothetical protein
MCKRASEQATTGGRFDISVSGGRELWRAWMGSVEEMARLVSGCSIDGKESGCTNHCYML